MTASARELERAIKAAPNRPGVFQRVEIDVADTDPLRWLVAQPSMDKGYWAERDNAMEIAAAGEADTIKGGLRADRGELFDIIHKRLEGAPAAMRYFGGFRFSDDPARDAGWRAFGAYRFLLPRFDLVRRGSVATLACNFRSEDKARALADARRLKAPSARQGRRLPRLMSRKDEPNAAAWARNVQSVLRDLERGRVDKVVLARRTTLNFLGIVDPMTVIALMREAMPGCFLFCGSHRGLVSFAGASPERLYRRDGRRLVTEALAGTRPRGATRTDDTRLARELRESRKEGNEHRLVVDSIRDILAPMTRALSVGAVPEVMKLANVQHLRTAIDADLRDDISDGDILCRLHPTPAVGGRPRRAALETIAKLESFDRGWYSGPVGWVGQDAAEFAVALRCGLALGPRLCLYAGAGIVKGSVAETEWRELEEKLSGFLELFHKK